MEVKIKRVTGWDLALDAARFTVSKESLGKEPSRKFIAGACFAEHSILRDVRFVVEIYGIPCWASQHIARHDAFALHTMRESAETHYVGTSRPDRTGGPSRHELPQDAEVQHRISLSPEDFINISKKRLCTCASPETRHIWQAVIEELSKIEPELAAACVPTCVYRGRCPEMNCCGFDKTEAHHKWVNNYWATIGR